jgi:site-specific recombinase XerD
LHACRPSQRPAWTRRPACWPWRASACVRVTWHGVPSKRTSSVAFHHGRHPRTLGAAEVEQFLTHLAVHRKVSAATQSRARQALLFIYRHVLQGTPWLVASLLYGGGLRLMEAMRLRVKDLAVERGEVIVREGKGGKDRVIMLHTADGERCARRPQPT